MVFRKVSADQVITMLKNRNYRYAQVHHTWKPNHADFTGSNHIALQQGMYNYHTGTRGWSDIGQHLTLYPDGTFVTGRNFGIAPAGISGYNTGSFMIEMIGDFDLGKDKLTGEQLNSALKVYNYLVNHCGAKILFHNEKAAKSCPGTGIDKVKFVKEVTLYNGSTKIVDVKSSGGGKVKSTKAKKVNWKKVTGNWTGQTLGNGEYGNPIKQLQEKLAANDPPFYPNKGAKNNGVDSYFGNDTEDAVRRFQTYYGLDVDGLAGKQVYGALNGKNQASGTDLIVDGKWGKAVNEALQVYFNTTVDGVLSGQSRNSVTNALYGGVNFGSGGSLVIKALQRKLGVKADGLLGPATIKALQKYLGTPQDGVLSRPSAMVKALQRKLNAGTF
ncbi:N-acetylmuramoyl-L-alanine amidase [Oceanobacillus sojae]|uniref:peptidoglycan recognition protein family protein n=1 Tax=Oceanobacillus sojae TaxID=582851 RepID=UPI0021A25CCB|nr:N-acetylmuramoyl-L-alanine amidase [Oceanobacillus sojae]MCT1904131.1 peptidoglycan-binding domain-containing protein [Oceanobacillus sojae]